MGPRYSDRPWKTILVRTVADGGESCDAQGHHKDTLPSVPEASGRRNLPQLLCGLGFCPPPFAGEVGEALLAGRGLNLHSP